MSLFCQTHINNFFSFPEVLLYLSNFRAQGAQRAGLFMTAEKKILKVKEWKQVQIYPLNRWYWAGFLNKNEYPSFILYLTQINLNSVTPFFGPYFYIHNDKAESSGINSFSNLYRQLSQEEIKKFNLS